MLLTVIQKLLLSCNPLFFWSFNHLFQLKFRSFLFRLNLGDLIFHISKFSHHAIDLLLQLGFYFTQLKHLFIAIDLFLLCTFPGFITSSLSPCDFLFELEDFFFMCLYWFYITILVVPLFSFSFEQFFSIFAWLSFKEIDMFLKRFCVISDRFRRSYSTFNA